jgi:hypothetical protein
MLNYETMMVSTMEAISKARQMLSGVEDVDMARWRPQCFPQGMIKEATLVERAREDRATPTNAPATTAYSARCASREAIQHLTTGIGMMRTMS